MTPRQLYAQFMNQCQRGFDNEHHWREWKKKHKAEIEALPLPLRKAVLQAHSQATHKAFSGAPKEGS